MFTYRDCFKIAAGAVVTVAMTFAGVGTASAQSITGAGSSFAYPIYSKWAYTYSQKTGVQLNYQSIGSGGGIKQIKAGNVDFGASDAPLKQKELDKDDLIQWPMAMGGVVPVVNLDGIKPGQLQLDGKTLAEIYLGDVTKWNDPKIAALNPNLKLPDQTITVVYRSDGSGTTWIFTNYLTKISSKWSDRIGNDKAVAWPVGLGGPQNGGVASLVQRVKGSIGYVEFAYALQNKMAFTLMKNKDGGYVAPTIESFQSAASNADWKNAPDFYMVLTDQPGATSWPITGATFVLMHKTQKDVSQAQAVLKWCAWSLDHGQDDAIKLEYVPMPENVIKLIKELWKQKMHGSSDQTIWPAS